ncbi:DEAD/DEAH box helicase [Glycomyces sp. L485]|uniref:DEAD/DEAH box helicase n=1 Tax=Glycomyces sp. L485 TaxID=2909235 RepID=UPI001F4AEAB2|nr:DEAD/DEAH box helicase [Glycomyces sp. L485]MCH7231581.1 DEAD/DEAH box helicase [Glycomyces sp. L485]
MKTTPPPIDRRKMGEHARKVVEQARVISASGRWLLAAPGQLQQAVRSQIDVLNREQTGAKLANVPTADLRKIVGRDVRLGILEQAGYDTVAKIRGASHHQMLGVPGVGARTIEEVKAAADLLAQKIASETRFRFDPDRKDSRQTRLLATLAAQRSAEAAAGALREPVRRYEHQMFPLLAGAENAGSRWTMFWSGRQRKTEAMSALVSLEAVVYGFETRSLVQSIDDALARCDPARRDPEELWREFKADAAAYNTAVAKITGSDTADAEALEDFISAELRQKIEAVPFDASLLKSTLRMYQLFGAKYAIHQERAVLGDEMGLGKTIQALAVCAHLAAKGQRRFLVVCPASVQANWIAEIKRHTHLNSFSLHGPASAREAQARQWLKRGGVAVTTFDTLIRLEVFRARPDVEPALLVVDEAHYVKNPVAKRSGAVSEMSRRSQRTLFLSGTPMENRVEEFKNLVSYLRPRLADRIDAGETIAGAKAFRRQVAPVYLRRNQEDVLTELPDKIEVEDWVGLDETSQDRYRSEVQARNLMGMRRAASAMPGSEKLERLADLVEEAGAEGRKVIVFSYFLDVLEAAVKRLGPVAVGPITGKVAVGARQDLIDEFTRVDGPAALLSQIDAGGVGLNIQAASVVVICEPQWKPSTEQQAIARAHRMGQVRKVQVHRLLAKDCVDERIREIQEDKVLLFEHYARRSEAKDVDSMAIDTGYARPAPLDNDSIPVEQRIIVAERIRLGLD